MKNQFYMCPIPGDLASIVGSYEDTVLSSKIRKYFVTLRAVWVITS